MAQLTITIANADVDRVLDALGGYQSLIDGEPNPQSKAQFTQEKIIHFLKTKVKNYESQIAMDAARLASTTDIT